MMLLSIYCTLRSCEDEVDSSQCSNHTIEPEFNYLSCFKVMYGPNDFGCQGFFTNSETQKTYIKYRSGTQKEYRSRYPVSKLDKDNTTILIYDKETYDKDDIIKLKYVPLTEEEKRIINNNNTCDYNTFSRFVDPDNYIGEKKINVTDKNVCFNVDKFEDLKDITDCGYATIKGKINNISFAFTNCFEILDKNVDETFKKYYYNLVKQTDGFFYQIYDIISINITDLDINNETRSKSNISLESREIQYFDMVVEDRYGNKVRYNQSSIIAGGDDEYDEPTKFINSSGKNSFNFMLLLYLILSLY